MSSGTTPESSFAPQGCFAEILRIVGTLMVHFFTLLLVLVVLVRVVPTFICIFAEFDTELPQATQFVITLSRFVVNFWFLALPLVLLVDTTFVLLLRTTRATRLWLLPLWCNLWLLGVILLLFVVVVAISVPMETIVQDMDATSPPPF